MVHWFHTDIKKENLLEIFDNNNINRKVNPLIVYNRVLDGGKEKTFQIHGSIKYLVINLTE